MATNSRTQPGAEKITRQEDYNPLENLQDRYESNKKTINMVVTAILAVIIGFFGVILAIQPGGESFSPGALMALAGSVSYALFMVATRRLAGTDGNVLMGWQLITALAVGGALVAWQGWTPPGRALDWVLLVVLGLGSLAGNVCVNMALRLAPASVVVPYQYTLIVWGILFGYFIFGEISPLHTLAGAAVIVGAGLFIFLREQQLRRSAKGAVTEP